MRHSLFRKHGFHSEEENAAMSFFVLTRLPLFRGERFRHRRRPVGTMSSPVGYSMADSMNDNSGESVSTSITASMRSSMASSDGVSGHSESWQNDRDTPHRKQMIQYM